MLAPMNEEYIRHRWWILTKILNYFQFILPTLIFPLYLILVVLRIQVKRSLRFHLHFRQLDITVVLRCSQNWWWNCCQRWYKLRIIWRLDHQFTLIQHPPQLTLNNLMSCTRTCTHHHLIDHAVSFIGNIIWIKLM